MESEKKVNQSRRRFGKQALAIGLGACVVGHVQAGELQAGFVITKDNFDKIKTETFEGKTIASMVPEKLEMMIKKFGLTIKLAHSKKIEMDPKYVNATKEYAKNVKFDPATRTMSGWKAGMPFPPETIKLDDPTAGDKVIWNLRAATYGATMDLRDISFVFINGGTGVERVQRWQSRRYYMEGRLDGNFFRILEKKKITQETIGYEL